MNEADVIQIISKYGFEDVYLEDISIRETAQLMNEASIVMSVQGAGLGNLVFCEPGTAVVELLPPGGNWWISSLCASLKLDYVCVQVDVAPGQDESKVNSDICADVSLIESALRAIAA
jgi:capsular polysaccharide biosynthesis protein